MQLPFEHPKDSPAWIDAWLTEADLNQLYPEKLRNYAGRALAATPAQRLDWTASSLCAFLGSHSPVWRLVNGAWRRTCTCGYVNDLCVHTYLAARLFNQVLRKTGWRDPGPLAPLAPAVPRFQAYYNRETTQGAAHSRNGGDAAQDEGEAPLFNQSLSDGAGDSPRRIEAEVDFAHNSLEAVLRFYLNQDGRRHLLRMEHLYRLCLYAQHVSPDVDDPSLRGFPPEDRKFLAWLGRWVSDPQVRRENLQVLKLARETFREWLFQWHTDPYRFLDRATQKHVTARPDCAVAKLGFELDRKDVATWELDAVITGPDGRSWHYRDLLSSLAGPSPDAVVDGMLLRFELPVAKEHLIEWFAKRPVAIPRDRLSQALPGLVAGRLDLVRGSDVRHEESAGVLRLEAIADGADVILIPTINMLPLRLDAEAVGGSVREALGECVIRRYASADLEPFRAALAALPHGSDGDTGRLRVSGSVENMQKLAEFWQRLPPGVEKIIEPDLRALFEPAQMLTAELRLNDHRGFIEFQIGWQAGDVRVSDVELRDAVSRGQSIIRTHGGGWLRFDPGQAETVRNGLGDLHLDLGGRGRAVRPAAARALQALQSSALPIRVQADCASIAARLRQERVPTVLPLSPALEPILRGYQKDGYRFLAERASWRVGAVLADDMGLGKTLQVLALFQSFFRNKRLAPPFRPRFHRGRHQRPPVQRRGALVVCPASVVAVWMEQAKRFCPDLHCATCTGTPEERAVAMAGDWDMLVTNYALLRKDIDRFAEEEYEFVVLDEAQQIKNPDAQVSQAVRRLRTPRPFALTGTPLENRTLDLWSIMHFVIPGYLGDQEAFLARYETAGGARHLAPVIAPFVLRRVKEAVAKELPSRTEEILRVEMEEPQRQLYDARLAHARREVKEKGPLQILAALTRLRQICCDPRLLPQEETLALRMEAQIRQTPESAKLECLLDLAEELLSEGHSLLVFSQFTEMLDRIREALDSANLPHLIITGETPIAERTRRVSAFQESETAQVFLLSLKAAGTGLTLTKADYVVIFDPWWNPAVERQAIDRTHRIGQTKPVIAYRLVAAGTIEEKILLLQEEKSQLFQAVMSGAESAAALPGRLTAEDLARILS